VKDKAAGSDQLERMVEALLFVADGSVHVRELAQALQTDEKAVEEAGLRLQRACAQRGIRVQYEKGRLQLVSAPEAAEHVERFLGLDLSGRLSRAATETVAIIAYRQPVTRAQVEAIRGVDCGGVLRTLTARGLIYEVDRLEQAGRPILYGTTFEFLRYFGVEALSELPPMEDIFPSASGENAGGEAGVIPPSDEL